MPISLHRFSSLSFPLFWTKGDRTNSMLLGLSSWFIKPSQISWCQLMQGGVGGGFFSVYTSLYVLVCGLWVNECSRLSICVCVSGTLSLSVDAECECLQSSHSTFYKNSGSTVGSLVVNHTKYIEICFYPSGGKGLRRNIAPKCVTPPVGLQHTTSRPWVRRVNVWPPTQICT